MRMKILRSCADSESLKGAGLRDVRVFSDFTIYESSDVWHFQYQRIQIYFVYKVSSLKIKEINFTIGEETSL